MTMCTCKQIDKTNALLDILWLSKDLVWETCNCIALSLYYSFRNALGSRSGGDQIESTKDGSQSNSQFPYSQLDMSDSQDVNSYSSSLSQSQTSGDVSSDCIIILYTTKCTTSFNVSPNFNIIIWNNVI